MGTFVGDMSRGWWRTLRRPAPRFSLILLDMRGGWQFSRLVASSSVTQHAQAYPALGADSSLCDRAWINQLHNTKARAP